MALKQKKDGTYKIESERDLQEVASAIEEREAARAEIEQKMEEEYDYMTMAEEIAALNEAMREFMADQDVAHVFRDNYQVTLVKRSKVIWDVEKLKSLLPKGMFLKVSRLVIDGDKIDDLVRGGQLDRDKISPALTVKAEKPHIRRYPYKDGTDKEKAMQEETQLRQQMMGETTKAAAKGGRK